MDSSLKSSHRNIIALRSSSVGRHVRHNTEEIHKKGLQILSEVRNEADSSLLPLPIDPLRSPK